MILSTLAFAGGPPGGLDLNPWVGLALGLFLVALNGFFVAAEFALVKVRPTQLDEPAILGSRRGRLANHMIGNLDAYLSACQVGITLASLALGWIGEPAFAWLVEPVVSKIPGATEATIHKVSIIIAFSTITVLHIVLGELAPKTVAILKPKATSLWASIPLFLFYKAIFPVIWSLNLVSNLLLKAFGLQPVAHAQLAHDEEELRRLVASTEPDQLTSQKREILDNVFELSHRIARQVMVPRNEVVYLNTDQTMEKNLERARQSGHTRFPLCKADLDHVTGLIHIKDIFRAETQPASLLDVKREIAFVPETLSLDKLLRRMRQEHVYMCAVLDEYGGVSGIVTLENVIEEIVGDIQDEFDAEEPELVKRGTNVWGVAGSMLVADFEDELELELNDRDEDTIAGVVLSELGRQAKVNDQVDIGRIRFEVQEVDGNRIAGLQATLLEHEDFLETLEPEQHD